MSGGGELSPVRPARPPAAYVGGKRSLARTIVARIEEIDHDGYAEPFVGMGGVFLRRTMRPRTEAINDLNGDIANLFRILQRHHSAFLDHIRFMISSREQFERLRETDPATLTDLERAARFLYLQRPAFGGKVTSRNFGVQPAQASRFDPLDMPALVGPLHERLTGVVIENLPWREFIDRYDRPGMLFYLDPPYWRAEDYYGKGMFRRDEFEVIADRLAALKGPFILSINDRPETREIFARFAIEPVTTNYSLQRGNKKSVTEILVAG